MGEIILLSIFPKWAEAILNGEKKWEYRRIPPKNITSGSRVILYATGNKRKIVGEFIVGAVLREPVLSLIKHTLAETPHTKEEINSYFFGLNMGCALEVKKYKKYEKPISLIEIKKHVPSFNPPQNFIYLRENNPKHKALLKLLPLSRKNQKNLSCLVCLYDLSNIKIETN